MVYCRIELRRSDRCLCKNERSEGMTINLKFFSIIFNVNKRINAALTVQVGFPSGSAGKESASNSRDLGVILGLGRSREGGHGNPLQYSCLENPLGQRNLAGYSPWGCKECDMTKQLSTQHRKKMSNRRTEICKTKKQILDMINRAKYCFFDQTYKTDKNL